MSLSGKVALVTGGGRGIGRAVVRCLLEQGAAVSICEVNKEAGEAAVSELRDSYGPRLAFLQCDVVDHDRLEGCFVETLRKFSGLDIVVNNAGVGDERPGAWQRMLDVNLKAAIDGTYLGLKYMGKDQGGRGGVVMNVGSTTCFQPFPAIPVYSATKAALNQFTRSIGDELYFKRSGVKVVCLNPGLTVTELSSEDPGRGLPEDPERLEHFMAALEKLTPQSAASVASGLVQLLSSAENGSLWSVEGGEPPQMSPLQ